MGVPEAVGLGGTRRLPSPSLHRKTAVGAGSTFFHFSKGERQHCANAIKRRRSVLSAERAETLDNTDQTLYFCGTCLEWPEEANEIT